MGILSSLRKFDQQPQRFSLNTGTQFDLATGSFAPGKDGHMILNGGLSMINGVAGRPQTFKTSIGLGYFTKTVKNYANSEGICYDTEMSIPGVPRLINLSGQVADPDLESRLQLYDKVDLGMEEMFSMTREIAHEKETHKADYIRETPFVDAEGKPQRAWVPTIIAIDSWSAMSSSKEAETYNKFDVGDTKTNMSHMADGRMKSDFMRQIPSLACSKGIYFVMTAHIGDKANLDPYAPVLREVPAMNNKDKLKNVGSQFLFLTTNLLQTRKASVLQDDKKKCLYPTEYSSDVELQEVSSIVCRCKNNVSGAQVDHISSQFYGIQEYLEYYQLIKDCKSELLTGTIKQKLAITEHEFTRHTIRKLIVEDPTFRRALEILGQFVYIRNRWNLPEVKGMGYVEFAKKFTASKDRANDMLNSNGIWSYTDVKRDKPYLSIIDIIGMINK